MRHFSTLLTVIVLGLAIGMTTSCTKQSLPPASSNASAAKDIKVIQQQDTSTDKSSSGHQCGGGHSNGNG